MEGGTRFHERFLDPVRIGSGSMGVVWRATDAETRRAVAVKTLHEFDPQALYRLKAEFRAASEIRHPNIVRLGEMVHDGGKWFFTMEYVDGSDFLSWIRRGDGDLDPARIRSAFAQLARGLVALHDRGLVHRDLKPSNVLVSGEGRVVILDFGLLRDDRGGARSTAGHVVGTVAYMAPEQCLSSDVGPSADWYAFGTMLWEVLAGRLPFHGSAVEILRAKPQADLEAPSSVRAPVDDDLDRLARELVRSDPAARPAAEEILRRLGAGPFPREAGAESLRPAGGRTGNFVGRCTELSRLEHAQARSLASRSTVVAVVGGESGIGKSALLEEATRRLLAASPPPLVLAGRCRERESVPFKAFDGVVDALSHHLNSIDLLDAALLLPPDAPILGKLFPVLRRVPAVKRLDTSGGPGRGPDSRLRAFSALRDLLAAAAERRPVVVVIDDFQWADADSLALLGHLVDRAASPAALFLLSTRTEQSAPGELSPGLLDALRRAADVEVVSLPPLSPGEAGELVRAQLGQDRPSALAGAIEAEGAGHPLFLLELVRFARENPRAPTPRLGDALRDRVEHLDAPARKLLETIAVAALPTAQGVVREAVGTDVDDFSGTLATLVSSALVSSSGVHRSDTVEPYHDRIAEVVLASMSAERLRSVHARLADALERSGDAEQQPQRLVAHLEGAGEGVRAAAASVSAARLARDAFAFDRAARMYREALRLGAADERELRWELALALVGAGRSQEAAPEFLASARGADTVRALDARRRAAEQLLVSGNVREGMAELRLVLARLGTRFAPAVALARVSIAWNRFRSRVELRRNRPPRSESEISPLGLIRLDSYTTVSHGLAFVDNLRGAEFQARGLRDAIRLGEPRRIARFLAHEACYVVAEGARAEPAARRLVDEVRRRAASLSDPYLDAWLETALAYADYFCGRLPGAMAHFDEAERRFRGNVSGANWELYNCRLIGLAVLRQMGSWKLMRERLDRWSLDSRRRGETNIEKALLRLGAIAWIADGDEGRAAEMIATREGRARPSVHRSWPSLRIDGELALVAGTGEGSSERLAPSFRCLRRGLHDRLQVVRLEIAWLEGRLHLAEGNERRAEAIARRIEREETPYGSAWALLLRGAIAARRGRQSIAAALLRDAASRCDRSAMKIAGAAARMSAARFESGAAAAELLAAGRAAMESEQVGDPERIRRVFVPGLPE